MFAGPFGLGATGETTAKAESAMRWLWFGLGVLTGTGVGLLLGTLWTPERVNEKKIVYLRPRRR